MKEATLLQERASGIECLANEVKELLHWNDQQYGNFVYETALSYLDAYYDKDQNSIDKLTRRKEFWNWWKSCWYNRDISFTMIAGALTLNSRIAHYRSLHNPHVLAAEIYPNRVVLGKDFSTVNISL